MMYRLINPKTDAFVEIDERDLHAEDIFRELVLDGYKPDGKRTIQAAARIVEADFDKQTAVSPKE